MLTYLQNFETFYIPQLLYLVVSLVVGALDVGRWGRWGLLIFGSEIDRGGIRTRDFWVWARRLNQLHHSGKITIIK